MKHPIYIKRLEHICQGWGGSFVYMDRALFLRAHKQGLFEEAPFAHGHGIDWWSKTVFIQRSKADPGSIIHEMGHLFAEHNPPLLANELDWLGWEICLARKVGCYRQWSAQNANYSIGGIYADASDWGACTPAQRKIVIQERLTEASALSLIDDNDQPRAIR